MPSAEPTSDLRVKIPSALKAQAITASNGKLTQWVIIAIQHELEREATE